MICRLLSLATFAAAFAAAGSALASEAQRLQGLFCNTEAQIDQARADIALGVSPRRAADRANRDGVVCTYVDRIEYLIARPVALGDPALPLVKYRGALVGVMVGDALRPVTPEVELHFLTPQYVAGAATERRT
jgi:hypothetical protein